MSRGERIAVVVTLIATLGICAGTDIACTYMKARMFWGAQP